MGPPMEVTWCRLPQHISHVTDLRVEVMNVIPKSVSWTQTQGLAPEMRRLAKTVLLYAGDQCRLRSDLRFLANVRSNPMQ